MRKVNIMKRQTLLLLLVAVMSLAGAAEAFCQSPQGRKNARFKSDRKMDVNRLELRGPQRSNEAVDKSRQDVVLGEIPDWLKDIIGPMPPGSPGPTFPEPELDELVTDIMVDILLEQQFGLEEYRLRIEDIIQECESRGIRCLYLTQPSMWRSDLDEDEKKLL